MPPSDVTASTMRQRAVLARDRGQLADRIQHAGGRFGVHHRDDIGRRCFQLRAAAPSGSHARAPLDVEPRHGRAVALRTSAPDDRRSSRTRPPSRASRPRRGWRPPSPFPTCRCRTPRTRTSLPPRGTPVPSRARTSSSSAIISGSRWLTVGAAIARITRGAVRLGPGPSRMRSMSGSRLMRGFPRSGRAPRAAPAAIDSGTGISGGRGTPTS